MELPVERTKRWNKSLNENDKYRIVQGVMRATPVLDVSIDQAVMSRLPARFNHDVAGDHKATDQKSSGRCWIFAALNVMRHPLIKKHGLDPGFQLSQSYLSRWDKLEKCNTALEIMYGLARGGKDCSSLEYTNLVPPTLEDGGTWSFFARLVKKYGVVPQEVVPETFNSEHTQRTNKMLLITVCKACSAIKRDTTRKQFESIKARTLENCHRIVTICMGSPPESFAWSKSAGSQGKTYTPLSFYKKIVRPLINVDKYVGVCNYPCERYNTRVAVEYINNVLGEGQDPRRSSEEYANLSMGDFKAAVLKGIKKGLAVWFTCDIGQFLLNSGKVLDFESSNLREMFDVDFVSDSKRGSLETRACQPNHAMAFVGCHEEKGKIRGWKVENSHGDDTNNKGYITMSDRWFEEFVYTAAVPRSCLPKRDYGKTKWLPFYCPLGTSA